MKELQGCGWLVRICRPAFQDFHRVLPRYQDRSELNRQLQKLRWWNPQESLVIDLPWNTLSGTGLSELVVEGNYGFPTGLRILFFGHQVSGSATPAVWVLGGLRIDEDFDTVQQMAYIGRSVIVKERASE